MRFRLSVAVYSGTTRLMDNCSIPTGNHRRRFDPVSMRLSIGTRVSHKLWSQRIIQVLRTFLGRFRCFAVRS